MAMREKKRKKQNIAAKILVNMGIICSVTVDDN